MKISIVIPTRERSQYLMHSVQTALEISDENIEIVVCDNASNDETAKVIRGIDDPRLVYVNTGGRVSMRQNFNHAFEESTGDYLIYFGDDDGISPRQFPFLRQILEKHVPDGLSWVKATYGWPSEFIKKPPGIRFYRNNCFGPPREYQGSDNLQKLLAADVGSLRPVPDIYHGCLSRSYMLKTASARDAIFDSAIPDVNLTYRAILKGGNFIGVDHPFSINGYSPASTGGGHGAEQKNQSNTDSSQKFAMENAKDPVSDVIPHAGSVPLAFFSTLETLRRNHSVMEIKPDYLKWYRYVLGSARNSPDLAAKLSQILKEHATMNNALPSLVAAVERQPQSKRSPLERLARFQSQIQSFRISTLEGTDNTVLTAAHTLDAILGQDYGAVLSGDLTPKLAWAEAKRRAKRFDRQL